MMKLLNVPVIQKRSTKMDRQPACIPPPPSTCSTTVAAEEEHQISFERLLVHHHTRDAPGLTTASNENTRTNNSLVDDDETNSSTVLDQVLVVGESYYLLNELVEVLSPKPREDERATDAGAKNKDKVKSISIMEAAVSKQDKKQDESLANVVEENNSLLGVQKKLNGTRMENHTDGNNDDNKLESSSNLQRSSTSKLEALAAVATADLMERERDQKMVSPFLERSDDGCCEKEPNDDEDHDDQEHNGTNNNNISTATAAVPAEERDTPRKDSAAIPANSGLEKRIEAEEEKKESPMSEDAMDESSLEPEAMDANNDYSVLGGGGVAADSLAKKPVDASGHCSLDRSEKVHSTEDASKDPPQIILQVIPESAKTEVKEENVPAVTPRVSNQKSFPRDVKSAPLDDNAKAEVEQTNDATATAANTKQAAEENLSSTLLLTKEQVLANMEREGFGLMARAEFEGIQQLEDSSRLPQEPDAQHRRVESSVASVSVHPSAESDMGNLTLDDYSCRPLPTHQLSYPPSPHDMRAPAGVAYVMMPTQAPGQAPHSFMPQPPTMLQHQSSFQSTSHQPQMTFGYQANGMLPGMVPMPSPTQNNNGKRTIRLKLQEEILARPSHGRRKSFFFARPTSLAGRERTIPEAQINEVDRGIVTVSWYEGTSSIELQEHVMKSVTRKLKLNNSQTLNDIRILDTRVEPPEEIVLCPYIPNGEEFVLRYRLDAARPPTPPPQINFYGPPESPSAAPSPHGNLRTLEAHQLTALRKQLDEVQSGGEKHKSKGRTNPSRLSPIKPTSDLLGSRTNSGEGKNGEVINDESKETRSVGESDHSDGESDTNTLQPESSVDAKLRQITELLLMDKQKEELQQRMHPNVTKRTVAFSFANYFAIFLLSMTAMAEVQARAPKWLSWMESQLENVANCSADQEALFKCVSNGEFAGLFATFILWMSRSALTKQIFLLGFDSPQKLWTVFYESLVGAFCWGFSYMFIRRGMNPDTRPQFLHRYWKDAVYGSLAGFNATFMKQVLKNLIPQEAVEEAFNDRQLKILSWLPTFS